MIATVRRRSDLSRSRPEPEVIVFQEPGLKINNKTEGKGRSKKTLANKEKLINKKVEEIYKKERCEGNALPAVINDLELTKTLRNEVFELGASNMDVELRGKALQKWRKRQRLPHEMLQKWRTESSKHKKHLSYPELMEQVNREKVEKFYNEEKRFYGDDMVKDLEKRGKKRKTVDIPTHLYAKHLSRTKVGKFRDGVLKLTGKEVRNVKHHSSKRSR